MAEPSVAVQSSHVSALDANVPSSALLVQG
jgi:hypothetical protein